MLFCGVQYNLMAYILFKKLCIQSFHTYVYTQYSVLHSHIMCGD